MGRAMNTLSHLSIGLGGTLSADDLKLVDYVDAQSNVYPTISRMPFIILRAKPNEVRKTVLAAREKGIKHTAFTKTMITGTWEDQLAQTAETKGDDMDFYGCVLFGDWDTVTEMTRKFSLWQ